LKQDKAPVIIDYGGFFVYGFSVGGFFRAGNAAATPLRASVVSGLPTSSGAALQSQGHAQHQ